MGRPLNLKKFGGPTSDAGLQLVARAKVSTNHRSASLIQQKNQYSFKVRDSSGEVGVCKLVDKSNTALLAGEMTITVTPSSGPTFRAKRITNKFVWNFSGQRFRWSFNTETGKVVVESETASLAT